MREPHIGPMQHGGYRLYISEPTFGVITRAEVDARHLYLAYHYRGLGNVKVHQLVCEAFHGPKPDGCDGVRHLNENGLDNRPENIEWSTQEVNLNDPNFKGYQRRRSHRAMAPNKAARRAGIYDSILDVARRRHAK